MAQKKIKCVVWDLDDTIWEGTLAEDQKVELRPGIVEIIKELDNRGILQSICSKNDYEVTINQLKKFGLDEYFLYPQISWNPKSEGIKHIKEKINIGMNTIAFVDNLQFELDEVKFAHNDVLCIPVGELDGLLDLEVMSPRFVNSDSKNRRKMYMTDAVRDKEEQEFTGGTNLFLATLNMEFEIHTATDDDLERMEELTVRTHQLNSTGTVYSYEELVEMIHSNRYLVLVAQLNDVYGSYGKIGIAVVEKNKAYWDMKLLLMSCRVMSKGVGAVLLGYIMKSAKAQNMALYADFIPNDRNRIMYITYRFNGFNEHDRNQERIRFVADFDKVPQYPDYIKVLENVAE